MAIGHIRRLKLLGVLVCGYIRRLELVGVPARFSDISYNRFRKHR
jgi:hypothetical protein